VGFEYNQKRHFLGNVLVHYLKCKEKLVSERQEIASRARRLREMAGWSAKRIYNELDTKVVNFRFIERSIYGGRKTAPRIGEGKAGFNEFLKEAASGLGESGMVWDEIAIKREIKFNDYVYDFTVNHPDHNFVANGFVVSNCGVRLVRTNLGQQDVSKHIQKLVDGLFVNIPCGVGSRSSLRLSRREQEKILVEGAARVVGDGYGTLEDIDHTEERGALPGADPSCVSRHAFERGTPQLGTLGAGNHFLEIQVVEKIYEPEIADVFRLEEGAGMRACHV
jgi:tRNA-splicing ligase RtcB